MFQADGDDKKKIVTEACVNEINEILNLLLNKFDKLADTSDDGDCQFKNDIIKRFQSIGQSLNLNLSLYQADILNYNLTQIQFLKLVIDLIEVFKLTNDPLLFQLLEILYILSTDDQMCAFLSENYDISSDLCEILLINTNLKEDEKIIPWKILLNVTRDNAIVNTTHHVTNMLFHCINKIMENERVKFHFEFLSHLARNNFEYTNELINTMSTKSQFERFLFNKVGNSKTDRPQIILFTLIIMTKLFYPVFITNSTDDTTASNVRLGAINCGLNYLFDILEESSEKTNKAITACTFLLEFFNCGEIRSLCEQDDKLLNVIVLKLNTAVLHQKLIKNKKLLIKLLRLFVEMSKNESYAVKFKQTLFNTEAIVKSIKKSKRTFNKSDHLNATSIEFINAYKLLLNFDDSSQEVFIHLCDFFNNIFKTMKFKDFKENNTHRLANTFINNFVQFTENNLLDINSNKQCVQKCFIRNLVVIDYFLNKYEFNEIFSSNSVINELNFKEDLIELIKLTILKINESKFCQNDLNSEILLLSTHILLNMIDNKKNQNECHKNEDDEDQKSEQNKIVYNYLKSDCFLKCLMLAIYGEKNHDLTKLGFDIIFKLNAQTEFSLDNFLKFNRIKPTDDYVKHQPNVPNKINLLISQVSNLNLTSQHQTAQHDSTASSSTAMTASTQNDLLSFYEIAVNEHLTYENDLISHIKLYSNRFVKAKYENSLLLNKLIGISKSLETEKESFNRMVMEKEQDFAKRLAQQASDMEFFKKSMKDLQDVLETKQTESEQAEKEYEESIEKLQKILGDERNAKLDLQSKVSELKNKLSDFDKVKLRQKECEALLVDKDNEIKEKLKEIENLKADCEKVKGLLAYVKNFNI